MEGPFRINRNPIYTGFTLTLTGWALSLGALSALIPAALYPVLVTHRFVFAEEAGLRAAFGSDATALPRPHPPLVRLRPLAQA